VSDVARREPWRRGGSDRIVASVALFVPLVLLGFVEHTLGMSLLGGALFVVLATKLLIARRVRNERTHPRPATTHPQRVSVVMPMHNEDPKFAVAAVMSMLQQSRPPDHVHVIDDGSTDGGAAANWVELALCVYARNTPWTVTRLPENIGKRGALAVGFHADPDADVFLCVDSDTVLDRDAIAFGLEPFCDPRTTAVAGFVTAQNWSRNLLTRLIDLRYVSAFLAERAAYSFFGAVLCCCGSLAFYRADIVRANLDDFLDQRFLGRVATYGDDRRLTNYALRAGRVVLRANSRASTAVPETLGHYIRQQIRWNKSFIRESLWVLGTFPLSANAFWLTLCEVFTWILVTALFVITLAIWPFTTASRMLIPFVALIALAAYARNAVYLHEDGRRFRLRDRLGIFALAPLYGILHLLVLSPLRFWSLATLRTTRWGTRQHVEVRYTPTPH
jgi:hyaluronan synthase